MSENGNSAHIVVHNDDATYTTNTDINGAWEIYSQSKCTLFLTLHAAQKNVTLLPIRKVSKFGNSVQTVLHNDDVTYTINNDIK